MADAIRTLEALLKERGRGFAYQAFDLCVFGAKTYRECADTLGVKESDVRNWVFAARSELRAIVRGLVRESVATAGDLDEEFAYLMDLFER
jgi:DNA-directed RNA polymerase specialized sigma24 family protein